MSRPTAMQQPAAVSAGARIHPPLSEQEKRRIENLLSRRKFPGRSSLRVREVAEALSITIQHVLNLIEEYRDTGGESGLMALNVASGVGGPASPSRNRSQRGTWRVSVNAFDEFVIRTIRR